MKVLITGGSGFIGSRLKMALQENCSVVVLTRDSIAHTSPHWAIIKEPIIQHDLRAPIPASLLPQLEGVTHIVHAAAEVGGQRSLASPNAVIESIMLGVLHTLELGRLLKLQRFIYLSSADVLGECENADESAPIAPKSPYAAAKAAGEGLCQAYTAVGWVPCVVARLGRVFGEGQRGARMVPHVFGQIAKGERVTCFKGGAHNWMHVEDCVDYLGLLLERGVAGATYHVAGPLLTNQAVISELVESMAVKMGVLMQDPPPAYVKVSSLRDTKLGISQCDHRVRRQLRECGRWYRDRDRAGSRNAACVGLT